MKALIRGEFGLGETLWKYGIGVMVVAMVLLSTGSHGQLNALGLHDSTLDSELFNWIVGFSMLVGFVYFTIQTIGLMRAFINDPKTKSGPRGRTWTTKIAATWILFYFAIWLSFFREVL
jgi:amino acid transporter